MELTQLLTVLMIILFAGISGINDGGNLVGTFLASRQVPARWSIILLILCIGLGPLMFGTAVSHTIAVEVVNFEQAGMGLLGISLFSALLILGISWLMKVPSSTTIALCGGMIGAAFADGKYGLIHWMGVAKIVLGMLGSIVVGFLISYLVAKVFWFLLKRMSGSMHKKVANFQYITVCLQGLAYGANDQEKAVGLLALFVMMRVHSINYHVSLWEILLALLFWIMGLVVGGLRIANTVSHHIFRMRSLHTVSLQASAAFTVIVAALLGLPVSTTQTTDGSLFGLGVASGPRKIRWSMVRKVIMVWGLTFPAALVACFACMMIVHW